MWVGPKEKHAAGHANHDLHDLLRVLDAARHHLARAAGVPKLSGQVVVLMSMRGSVPEFAFFYIAQLLMVFGNLGPMMALRMYLHV